jgi:HSP20 family molecular chaperone IbpA
MSKDGDGKDDDRADGFARIAGGLGDLINLLVNLDKTGELPRRGRREKDGLVVEYSIGRRTATGDAPADPPPPQATEAPRSKRRTARRSEVEVLEPVTDTFDEPGEMVLMFELPGVERADIRCLLDGDILLLDARATGRLYRKEMLIEAKLAGDPPQLRLHNGVLEVRLRLQD